MNETRPGPGAMGETEYFKQRLDDQIEWYDKKSSANQRAYKRLRLIEIVAAASIPLLAGYSQQSDYIGLAVGVIGLMVAVIAGLLGLYRFQENWTEYRATAEALRQERFLYLTRTAPYNAANAFELLVGRVEDLLKTERSGWAVAMRAASKSGESQPSEQTGRADLDQDL